MPGPETPEQGTLRPALSKILLQSDSKPGPQQQKGLGRPAPKGTAVGLIALEGLFLAGCCQWQHLTE